MGAHRFLQTFAVTTSLRKEKCQSTIQSQTLQGQRVDNLGTSCYGRLTAKDGIRQGKRYERDFTSEKLDILRGQDETLEELGQRVLGLLSQAYPDEGCKDKVVRAIVYASRRRSSRRSSTPSTSACKALASLENFTTIRPGTAGRSLWQAGCAT